MLPVPGGAVGVGALPPPAASPRCAALGGCCRCPGGAAGTRGTLPELGGAAGARGTLPVRSARGRGRCRGGSRCPIALRSLAGQRGPARFPLSGGDSSRGEGASEPPAAPRGQGAGGGRGARVGAAPLRAAPGGPGGTGRLQLARRAQGSPRAAPVLPLTGTFCWIFLFFIIIIFVLIFFPVSREKLCNFPSVPESCRRCCRVSFCFFNSGSRAP